METKEKTKLEVMLFEKGVTMERMKDIIGVKTTKSVREKLDKVRDWKLDEMKAIQTALFPELTLEAIFEGY